MRKTLLTFFLSIAAAFGQYKMEALTAPPSEVPAALASLLQKQGVKITGANGSEVCEVWLRAAPPAGAQSMEEGVSLPFPVGSVLGVIKLPASAQDRRGQKIQPGVYTL